MLSGRFGKKLIYDKFSTIISIILTVSLVLGLIPGVDLGNSLLDGQNIKIESNINPNDYSLREMEDFPKIEDYSHIDTTQNHILEQDEIEEIPELEEFNHIESSQNIFPDQEEIESYIEDGTWDARVEFMQGLRPSGPGANLIQNLKSYEKEISDAFSFSSMSSNLPEGMQTGMATTGEANVVVLTVEFADYKFDSDKKEILEKNFFSIQNINDSRFPYESVSAFYERSSYSKLNIQGDVFTGASLPVNRSHYDEYYFPLVLDTINQYESMGVDFSQYDGNGDGIIDNIYVHFAGPDHGWGSTWWSYCTYRGLFDDHFVDGVKLGTIVVLHNIDAITSIHETGHVLGLPDYYDYENILSDPYVTGIMADDILNNNYGDHNGFSKLMLGWIENVYFIESNSEVQLRPLGEYGDIAIIFIDFPTYFSEYFLVEYSAGGNFNNSKRTGIDDDNAGLRIFHVNAVIKDNKFKYSNTSKIKLIEARRKSSFDSNDRNAAYFYTGDEFSPYTVPSSGRYVAESLHPNIVYNETTYSGIFIRSIRHIKQQDHEDYIRAYYFDVVFEDQPFEIPLIFEFLDNDLSFLNSVLDFQLRAPGNIYSSDLIKPYIVFGNDQVILHEENTHGYNFRNIVRLMLYNDIRIEPNTDYKIVIPEGAYHDEIGNINEYQEILITTEIFLQADAINSIDVNNIDVGLRTVRDDGMIVALAKKDNYLVPDCLRVVDPTSGIIQETYIEFNNEGLDGFSYLSVIELYDGNLAFIFKKNDLTLHYFKIIKVDLYGSIISEVNFESESTYETIWFDIVPFNDGLVFRNHQELLISDKVKYIDLNTSGGSPEGVKDIHVGSKSFTLYSVDRDSFCVYENIHSLSTISKGLVYNIKGELLSEFYLDNTYGTIVVSRNEDGGIIVFFKRILDSHSKFDLYVSKFVNNELIFSHKMFENQGLNIVDPSVRKSLYGFEIHQKIYIRYGLNSFGSYSLLNFYDKNLNLVASRAIMRESQGLDVKVSESSDGKMYLIWWNGFEIFNNPEMNTVIKPFNIGDINNDGRITTVDALMALQAASGRIALSDQQKLAADVNKDGRVSTVDALMILQYASGRIDGFVA